MSSDIKDHISNMPEDIRNIIKSNNAIKSILDKIEKIVSGPRVEYEMSTPQFISLATGLSAKLVCTTNATDLPTFSRWNNKFNKILGKYMSFRK